MSFLRDLLWPTVYAFHKHRFLFGLYALLFLLLGVYPALNVLVIGYLGNQIANHGDIFLALLYIVLLFGFYNAFFQMVVSLGRSFMAMISMEGFGELANHSARVAPYLNNDQPYLEQLRQAFGAVAYTRIGHHNQAILSLLNAVVTAIALCWSLWQYNHWVALIAIVIPIPVTLNNLIYGRQESKYWPQLTSYERRREYLHDQLASERSGFDLSSLHGGELISQIAQGVNRQWYRVLKQMHFLTLLFSSLSGIITISLYAGALALLIAQGELVSLLTGIFGLTAILTSIKGLGYNIGTLMEALPSNRAFRVYLQRDKIPLTRISAQDCEELVCEQVCVSYGEKQVVKNVNLTLQRKQLVALVGANGSGKTSLINALMGMQLHATGTMRLKNQTIDLSTHDQVLDFATVNQDFQRFDLSVREFVTLGLTNQVTDEQVWQVLAQVEFADYVRGLPQGLDTEMGVAWGGIDLSGGQWQRLCVARGLLSDRGLLFLDEPTSAIDAPTEERIFAHLKQASEQRLILLTTHRVSTLKDADLIYVMEHGEIVESGSFAELNQPGTAFRKLFESQFVANEEISH